MCSREEEPQRPNNEDSPHLPSFAARRVYSRQELFALPSQKYHERNSGLVSGDLKQTGFYDTVELGVPEERSLRALTNKVDEIQEIAEFNSISAICITETWLSPNVPDSCVAIPGYNLFRKDRITTGGGVCIYLDHNVNF